MWLFLFIPVLIVTTDDGLILIDSTTDDKFTQV